MTSNFTWTPDGPLPPIADHTRRKLDVIAQYLEIYLDTLSQNVRMDRLNVSLVDGFCGGGAYQGDEGLVLGSPLVLLKMVEDAERRLNEGRRKPLIINAKYWFVDAAPDHVARLRRTLSEQGYIPRLGDRITILEGAFESHLPAILRNIKSTQRTGRSIFLLDQCGHTDVQPETLDLIFGELQGAEIILTFAIDPLLNFLGDDSLNNEKLRELGITRSFLDAWRERNGNNLVRPLAQRTIMNNLRRTAGFMTPFMLRSQAANRDMALIHLSNHQAARDKMLGVHWQTHNSFIHCGKGSLYTLGFDSRFLDTGDALFSFHDEDRTRMRRELKIDLPELIHEAIREGGLPVTDLLDRFGNQTAAQNSDMFDVIRSLVIEGDLVIKSPSGGLRRLSTLPSVGDMIEIPAQKTFFSMLRNDDR